MIVALSSERRTASGRILPLDPGFARWYERIHGGARFRVDFKDQLRGPLGQPYFRLRLAAAGDVGHPLLELALMLYNCGFGALVCHPDGNVEPNSDHLEVSFGDVVDLVSTGTIVDRVPATPPWGYVDRFPEDCVNCPLDDPGVLLLPYRARRGIAAVLAGFGATDPGVSLMRLPNGLQTLVFTYEIGRRVKDKDYQDVAGRILWHLPRYYAALIIPMRFSTSYPLVPED